MLYLTIKAVHIIGAVSWFAGLFYGIRLFVYHAEAPDGPEGEELRKQFSVMSQRLWSAIAKPAMVVTLIFGGWLLALHKQLDQSWIHLKLIFVLLLVMCHVVCERILKAQRDGSSTWTSTQLRLLNEGPTLLLVGIVVAAVFKTLLSATILAIALALLTIMLLLGFVIYRRSRTTPGDPHASKDSR